MSVVDPIDLRGTGNINAELFICGEAYGQREEMLGAPFVGTSGDELNRYLSSIRISRDSVYVSNVVNERPPNNSDPTREMIERHSLRLGDELLTVRPKYVLALGRYALQWFLGPDASITREWGLPHTVPLCGYHGLPDCTTCGTVDWWDVVVVGAHHPAYGLYMPDDQILIQEALEGRMQLTWGLRRVMDGELEPHPPVDEYPNPEYRELTDPDEIELVLGAAKVVALDTEGSPSRPWCISVCVEPGKAYVIAASNEECVRALAAWFDRYDPLVVMHFATHDIEVLAAMGITVRRLGDSMLIAHLLGPMFSQALKLGAYRELGMHMRDYTDLTRDADRALAVEYLERVLAEGRCVDCRGRGIRAWRVPETVKPGWTSVIPAGTRRVMTKLGPVVKFVKEKTINHKAKVVPAHYESGQCEICEGDGTSWPVPRALPVWDKGRLTLWQPSPVGKRVRRILDDVRAGKTNKDGEPTDPRARWEGADPPEAIATVIDRLGPMPTATLDMVPRQEAIEYAACDADATLRRWLLLDPLIDTWGLRETYNTDLAILPLIVDMQRAGMQVDKDYFAKLSAEWRAEMSRIRHRLQKLVGYYVNPASSKQVANLLFVKLGLTPVKQTRSKESESTDDKVLEQLLLSTKNSNPVAHEAITLITRHREIHKLDGTYAEPLSKVESRDGRVRMEFRYTRTPTGRLSSAKPRSGQNKRNYIQGQNIPTRTDEGKRIRKGIVARDGYLLASHDLSQIEWRVMAHLSKDPNLLRVFREGHDLHKMTASLIYKIPISEVTSAQRSLSKNIGFGIGYKISWRGLQQQFAVRGIELTRDEAQAFIDGFMAAYPGIAKYWESVFAEARRNGYVRHPDGRIRWATAIRCTASWVREAAERELGNSPVQGFAAWIMKRIMIAANEKVIRPLNRSGFDVKMLLVVHDSLESEFPDGVEAMFDPLMRRVMRETVRLSVPVMGSGAWGPRWSDCKE
jgi:uracil-DNA glycosylase family 4